MPVKVSVVVPVYNPGRYIDRCIRSILDQSLPDDEFEAIFVDDGSTDKTPGRLDALAAEHRNIRTIHQENSGWPGKPRNVGIAAASGEYVFFLDHDDALGREALERMYAMAVRNGSDVVIGKMAGHYRGVPKHLFFANRDRATLADAPLLDALTPHKLFRRAFIEEHGLRFPEGRRRLEDHVFVVNSYFLADVISVLADYICYYHYRREDRANAGLRRLEPAGYFGNLREVIGIVEANTEPGPFRDSLLERFARAELLGRLRGRGFIEHPEEYRRDLFAEIRGVVEDRIGPGVDERLAPAQRAQMALLRAGRLDLLVKLAQAELQVTAHARLTRLEWTPELKLSLAVETGLNAGHEPLGVERHGDRLLLRVPDEVAAVLPDDARLVPRPLSGRARLVIRRHDDSAELVVPASVELRVEEGSDGDDRLTFALQGEIDPRTVAGGEPIWAGQWDVVAIVEFLGYTAETRLKAPSEGGDMARSAVLQIDSLSIHSSWPRPKHHLTLDIGAPGYHRPDRRLIRRSRGFLGRVVRRVRRQAMGWRA
jgi:glycosyltransferase involved in cell wall biosynthesis